jgi:hypothetical protein
MGCKLARFPVPWRLVATVREMGADLDLAAVETAVLEAIRSGDRSGVRLLGHGEISIVLGWPTAAPECALKRVPPFRTLAAARDYIAVCDRNFELLRDKAVPTWPTELLMHARDDGRYVVYHRQPIADAALLGSNVLRAAPPADAHPLLDAIVRHTAAVVGPGVGFDVQVANWLWDGLNATQIDFTSPFLFNDAGDDLLFDTRGFAAEYPWIVRGYLRRELLQLVGRFTTPEGAIGDMVANLHKEGLQQWVAPALRSAKDQLGITIDPAVPLKMYADDRSLMPLTLRLRKMQRAWMLRTGRRYDAMLPDRTTYERQR